MSSSRLKERCGGGEREQEGNGPEQALDGKTDGGGGGGVGGANKRGGVGGTEEEEISSEIIVRDLEMEAEERLSVAPAAVPRFSIYWFS